MYADDGAMAMVRYRQYSDMILLYFIYNQVGGNEKGQQKMKHDDIIHDKADH